MPMEDAGRPVIAVAVPISQAHTKYRNYFDALEALGALPRATGECDPDVCDGLLLPGGVDVNPKRYGQENVACGPLDDELDALQFSTLDEFVKAGKPVFGICRGQQLINVYFGGTLIQNLPGADIHTMDEETRRDRAHDSVLLNECYLTGLYGPRFPVNSAHHQAVDRPGEGLIPLQRSADGVIEAIAHVRLPVRGVQWHPERMTLNHLREDTVDGGRVIRSFIELCGERSR